MIPPSSRPVKETARTYPRTSAHTALGSRGSERGPVLWERPVPGGRWHAEKITFQRSEQQCAQRASPGKGPEAGFPGEEARAALCAATGSSPGELLPRTLRPTVPQRAGKGEGSSGASFQPSGGALEPRSRTRLGTPSRPKDLGEDPGPTPGLCELGGGGDPAVRRSSAPGRGWGEADGGGGVSLGTHPRAPPLHPAPRAQTFNSRAGAPANR